MTEMIASGASTEAVNMVLEVEETAPTALGAALSESEPGPASERASAVVSVLTNALECVSRELGRVVAQQAAIEAKVDESLRLGELRERTIDRLHAENQALRLGEREHVLTPVFRDLIAAFDALAGLATRYAETGETTPARDVATIRDTMADILGRYDVERFSADPGTPVLMKEHQVLRAIPGSPAQDCTIAEVHRVGFRTPRRVLRSVEVTAYKAVPPPSQNGVAATCSRRLYEHGA